MRPTYLFALALLATAPAPATAQSHGAPPPAQGGGQASEEARQLHSQFFADPRIYGAADGHRLVVGPFRMPGSAAPDVRVFDPASGRIIAVTSTAMDTLTAAEGERFVLREHGRVIEWRRGDTLVSEARVQADVRHENIEVRNGSVTLAGRFSTAGAGRRPAIVFVHGSGPGDRNDFYYALLAAHLVDQGFAVVTYDKRSVGQSTGGDWQRASMPELASDLNALIRYTQTRPDVDRARVGVFGVSQASWVAPLAAMDVRVPFMALFSGAPVDTWGSELNETEMELAAGNFTEAQKRDARAAIRLMFEAAETGTPTPQLIEAVRSARGQPWFSSVDLNDSAANLAALRAGRYDPRAVLERFDAPLFLAFGATDLITPYRQYAPIWHAYAQTAGAADDLTLKVYPGANHGLLIPPGQNLNAPSVPFAPGAIGELTTWLREHAGLAQRTQVERIGAEQWRVLADPERYLGGFRSGENIIATAAMNGGFIRFDDFERGRLAFLAPVAGSPDLFAARAPNGAVDPNGLRVRFHNDGQAIVLSQTGSPERTATRVGVRVEDVSVNSNGLRQMGLLITPSTPGPHPVVMFFGGAGPSTRENFRTWGYLLAAHGIAALTFDKRGDGQSEGNAATARLGDLAQDGVAWFDYLLSRSDIDHARIGAIGLSRGGWTAPMTARERPQLAFLLVSSGGPISVRESERYNRLLAVARAGHSREAQVTAARVLDDYFDFLASNGARKRARITQHWARYSGEAWFPLLRMPTSDPTQGPVEAWPPGRTVFADDLRLDARVLYRDLDVPVLFVFGGADQLVPQEETRAIIANLGRNKADWTVRVFEDAGHNFETPAAPGQLPRTVPGYYETLVEWLGEHAGTRR